MTHKIAILKMREVPYSEYGDPDGYQMIVQSITDWEEVSEDDFRTLQLASRTLGFAVIEQPLDTKDFLAKTIKEYTALARAQEKRAAEEKKKKEELALARKFKKELKSKSDKEQLLVKLVDELGVDAVKSALSIS